MRARGERPDTGPTSGPSPGQARPDDVAGPGGRSLAHRVRTARRRGFVGRLDEIAVFEAALRGEPGAPRVLLLHGPGGIGKSALLRRFGDAAQSAGRPVVMVDGRTVVASTDAFADEAAPARGTPGAVLLVDTFEQCQTLEGWVREEFLLDLAEDAVVVIAGRHRPEPQWTADAGWRELSVTLSVDDLPPADADALLDERGVPQECRPMLTRFAGGHPLALSLAAEAAAAQTVDPDSWLPPRDLVETLLTALVDQAPSTAAEYALQVCAHVRHTTVDLLRTGLD